jgi:hypothetical protein
MYQVWDGVDMVTLEDPIDAAMIGLRNKSFVCFPCPHPETGCGEEHKVTPFQILALCAEWN